VGQTEVCTPELVGNPRLECKLEFAKIPYVGQTEVCTPELAGNPRLECKLQFAIFAKATLRSVAGFVVE